MNTFKSILLFIAFIHFKHTSDGQVGLPPSYPVGTPINLIRSWEATAPEQNGITLMSRGLSDVKMVTQYLDGLGRPMQTVLKQGSLQTGYSPTDLVSTNVYDEYGMERINFLQYPETSSNDGSIKTDPFTAQSNFYNNLLSNQAGEVAFGAPTRNWAYNQMNFEASPLKRVQENFAPGVNWSGTAGQSIEANRHAVKKKYWLNTANDVVRIWKVTNGSFGTFGSYSSASGTYATGQLFKNVTINEQNNQVIEFTDKEGKLILKKVQLTASDNGSGADHGGWLCTYYIYDELRNLRCVVQPEATRKMHEASNWDITPYLNEQCFRYEYDQLNRIIIKKDPGAGGVYSVYDSRNRLVMTQDANMRQGTEKWLVTKYDGLNRPIETGLWENSTAFTTHLSTANGSSSYPTTSGTYELLTVTHYDDYTSLPSGLTSYLTTWNGYFSATDNMSWPYPQMPAATTNTKGMPTWTQTRILGTSDFLNTVNYYDEKGRVIQTQSTNITGGADVVTTQYSWVGQPLIIIQKQENAYGNGQTTVIVSKRTYDALGRMLKIAKRTSHTMVNSGTMSPDYKTVVEHEYNKLGQLKIKKLGSVADNGSFPPTTGPLETLTYDYNVRGWLLGMNREYVKDVNTTNYFGFDLGYDKINNNLIGNQNYLAAQYNGNITGTVWKSKGDGEKRKYDFTYDAINRLLRGDFTQYTNSSFNQDAGVNYNIKVGDGVNVGTAYDANGNIKQMQQWGLKVNSSAQLDNIRYTYYSNSNQLKSATDFTNDAYSQLGDFITSETHPQYSSKAALTSVSSQSLFDAITDYTYDGNGNMITDLNKGMTDWFMPGVPGIRYNYLNLPEYIDATNGMAYQKTVTFVYDAKGNKLQKIVYDGLGRNRTEETTTTYIGGMVYETFTMNGDPDHPESRNNILQFAGHEEGRIRFKPAVDIIPASLEYDYMIKDHLSNVRMVLTEEQRQIVYPAATLEDATYNGSTAVSTEALYYNIDASKIVANPSGTDVYPNNNGNPPYNNNPFSNTGATTSRMYKTNASANKIGLGITLKVMAGDIINIYGKSYHKKPAGGSYTNPVSYVSVTDIITAFTGSGVMTGKGITSGTITGASGFPSAVSGLLGNQPAQTTELPRASINWIILDEQFKYVSGGFDMANGTSGSVKSHTISTIPSIPIPKNGYIYVYVSNESAYDVFFDNLQVIHTPGPILEETHYYPFGLTMARISSRTAGSMDNKYEYNGKERHENEFSEGGGLGWSDYGARMYDPQIGRFLQIDPHSHRYATSTPYNYVFNNPLSNVDPDGKDGRVTGTGTEDDPYTIEANYYYYGLNEKQTKGLNKALANYNNGGKATKVKVNGKEVYVRYRLSATQVENADQAETSARNDTYRASDGTTKRFGNVVNTEFNGSADAYADANNFRISINERLINEHSTTGQEVDGKNYVLDYDKLISSALTHELGHNLTGIHGDPGGLMVKVGLDIQNNQIGGSLVTINYPNLSKPAIAAMVGRINQPYGTDYAKDADYIEATRRGETVNPRDFGTAGRIYTQQNN